MADISKISLDGNSYNIKDETARAGVTRLTQGITLLIGDSYGKGLINYVVVPNAGWCYHYKQISGLGNRCLYQTETGAGFTASGSEHGYNFTALLNQFNVANPELVDKIVVAGGWNDKGSTISAISNAISDFMTAAKTQYPNATVYLAMISNGQGMDSNYSVHRLDLIRTVIPAYQNITAYGGVYIKDVNLILKDYTNYTGSDNTHPNDTGYTKIAQCLWSAVNGGTVVTDSELMSVTLTIPTGFTSTATHPLFSYAQVKGGNILLLANATSGYVNFSTPMSITGGSMYITMPGVISSIPVLRETSSYAGINAMIALVDANNKVYRKPCILKASGEDLSIQILTDEGDSLTAVKFALLKSTYMLDANWA